MVRSKVNRLRFDKAEAENRKLTYEVMSDETGLSKTTLVGLINNTTERMDFKTIDALCRYFGCGVGDVLEFIPEGASVS